MQKQTIQGEQIQATTSSCANFIKARDVFAAIKEYKTLHSLAMTNTIKQIVIRYQKYNKGFDRNLIKFFDSLPTIEATHLGYKHIIQEMNRLKSVYDTIGMTLAYRAFIGLKQKDLSDESKKSLEFIWKSIPNILREFPWDKPFSLYNVGRRQLLIASDIDYDSKRQMPFLWKSDEDKLNGSEKWIIEAVENGFSFRIKSIKTGLYLYTESKEFNYDSHHRRIFLWKRPQPARYAEWNFIPTDQDFFKIENAQWNAFVSVSKSDFDNDHRQITTETAVYCDEEGQNNMSWKINQIFDE